MVSSGLHKESSNRYVARLGGGGGGGGMCHPVVVSCTLLKWQN